MPPCCCAMEAVQISMAMQVVMSRATGQLQLKVRAWIRKCLDLLEEHWVLYEEGEFDLEQLFSVEWLEVMHTPWYLRLWLPGASDMACGIYRELHARWGEIRRLHISMSLAFRSRVPINELKEEVEWLSRFCQGLMFADAWMEKWFEAYVRRRDLADESSGSEDFVPIRASDALVHREDV